MTEPVNPIAVDQAFYRVDLPTFEGPLDLLLHLIQKHELDILDIPVSFITEKYLEYLRLMQALDLDLAAEYLLMAATLAHIKSRMLLPTPPPEEIGTGELDEFGDDPRAMLVKRLLEYQKFKAAGEALAARGVAGRDVFMRGAEVREDMDRHAPLAPVSLFSLIEALQRVAARKRIDLAHEITAERVSIAQRMTDLVDFLQTRGPTTFDELFEGDQTTIDLVVTFLALLEMTRLRMTQLYQPAPLAAIHVTLILSEMPAIPTDVT